MTNKKKIVFYIFVAIILFVLGMFFYRYRIKLGKIVSPFFIAIIIAYLLNPLVKKLEKKKIPRWVAILLIYLLFTLALVSIIIFIIPEMINNTKELMATLPDITARYQGMFDRLISVIQSSNWPADVKDAIFREIQNGVVVAQNYITNTLKSSLSTFIRPSLLSR